MVYAVIVDLLYNDDFQIDVVKGTVRLVKKGDIPLPKDVQGSNDRKKFYHEQYFTNYAEAKATFQLISKNRQALDGNRTTAIDDT